MTYLQRAEEEEIKEAGITIDLDEIGRKGTLGRNETILAKWHGIYKSRQVGNQMVRIVTTAGVLSSSQARNMAKVSEKYGQGVINITTRQAIQLHWVKVPNLADVIRELADEGTTTKHGAGDVNRIIAACPLAETCQYRRFDVRPYALKTQKYIRDAKDLEDLPRKFKISFSGCPAACAQPSINCIGFVAVQRERLGKVEKGFKVYTGGGLASNPHIAPEIFSFIPLELTLPVARAITLAYRDHGDRYNRSTARWRVAVALHGIDQVRKWVLECLEAEGFSPQGIETDPFVESGLVAPDRPLAQAEALHKGHGSIVRVMVPKGEMTHLQFKSLAELSEVYADQKLYTTNRQNIEFHGVEFPKVEELKAEVRKLGLGTEGFYGLRDIVPCVGTTYCPKAVAETRALYDLLLPVVSQIKYKVIDQKALINITGCPNSCSPYRIADLGFRGMRIREDQGSVEGFEMTLGGDLWQFGRKLGEFKVRDLPEVVETVLDAFVELRQGEETLAQTVSRLGIDPFTQRVFA